MASGYANTSDSIDETVTDVPEVLLEYAVSDFVQTLLDAKEEKKLSAKVHQAEGQSPKFMFMLGDSSGQARASTPRTNDDSKKAKTILVKNVPATADEDLLEMFFETTKKQGGGPVQSVKILRDKNVAFVEFCDRSSVEKVMKKRPIKLGTTVLDVEPYEPLLQGSEKINRMDIIGLPASFTDGLLKEHLEILMSPQGGTPTPSAEPKCETLTKNVGSHTPPAPTEKLTARTQRKSEKNTKNVRNLSVTEGYSDENGKLIGVGSRVVRGRDWWDGNQDGGGEGTVTGIYSGGVNVRWDNGNVGVYYLEHGGHYQIKLHVSSPAGIWDIFTGPGNQV